MDCWENNDINFDMGHDLAIAYSVLELRDDGDQITSFDVGVPGSEPLIGNGIWRPESNERRT